MKKGKTGTELISAAERRAVVLEFRKAGGTLQDVAEAVERRFGRDELPAGWDSLYVAKDIQRELGRLRKESGLDAEEIRALERERLDRLWRAVWPLAMRGDLNAVDRCLRLMERRARLEGIDAPRRLDVSWRELIPAGQQQAAEQLFANDVEQMLDLMTGPHHE